MFHTNSNLSKKSNLLSITITQAIKDLPPIKPHADTLWEEMSEKFIGKTIISHMSGLREDLAVDLHRLNEGDVEELSGGLWVKWRRARETTENILRGIRGNKKDVMRQLTKEDYDARSGEYKRVLRQHGRLPVEKVNVEYSGGRYSNQELLSYYEGNKGALESISANMDFESFVENFLARLSSTPRLTTKHKGKQLGATVPLSLLEVVQDDIDFETYDLSESTFQSGMSSKQTKALQVKYDDAVAEVLVREVDSIRNDMRSFIEGFIKEKEKETVYNKNNLVRREGLDSYRKSINFYGQIFDRLYESLGGIALLKSWDFDTPDFDFKMVNEEKFKNGWRQIATTLFGEVITEKLKEAQAQLKAQIGHINKAWKSNKKLGGLLEILKRNEVTTKDVKDYVGRLSNNDKILKDFYDEILGEVNVESYLKSSFSYKTRLTRTDGVNESIREYTFKKSGRAKLNTEIDRILESHSAFESVANRANHYVKIKIKEQYAQANGIEVGQIEG